MEIITISCNKLFKNIIVFLSLGMWEQNGMMETLLRAFILLYTLDRRLLQMLFSSAEWYKEVERQELPGGEEQRTMDKFVTIVPVLLSLIRDSCWRYNELCREESP